MNFKNIISTVLLLIFSFALHASVSCPVPPPSQIVADTIGHDYIDISWVRNTSDVSYRIRVTDTGGSVVAIDTILDNNYHLGNLTADTEYNFTIRASSCAEGPFGTHISAAFRTGTIIFDDLVIYLNCPESAPTSSAEVIVEDVSEFIIDPTLNSCYLIEPDMTISNATIGVKLLLTANSNGGLNFREIPPFLDEFDVVDQNGIKGEYTASDNSPTPLFNFHFGWLPEQQEFKADIIWQTTADLLITDCSSCIPHKDLKSSDESNAKPFVSIYPNPVKDRLNIKATNDGQMEIRDITGRLWYSAELLEKQNNLQILTNAWPKGTYILHWYKTDAVPSVQYFIKL